MDHALRTISYIADIGNIVVLMARRRMPRAASQDCIATTPGAPEGKKQYKMICHVFESEDVSERRAGPQHCRRLGNRGRWGRLAVRGPRGPGATGRSSTEDGVGGAVIWLLAKKPPSPEVLWPRPFPGDVPHTLLHPRPPHAGAGQEGVACGSDLGTP